MHKALDRVLVALLSPVVISVVSAQTIRIEPRFATMDRSIAIHISGTDLDRYFAGNFQ